MTSIPPSPEHPQGDEEVKELPQGGFDIDLNPGISSDEDDEVIDNNKSHDLSQAIDVAHVNTNGMDDFEIKDVPTITSSFEEEYELVKDELNSHDSISLSQQSKFVNYIDEELLKLQRKFVKTQSGEIRFELTELIVELKQILKLIWRSISVSSHNNIEYFIKILNDLEDYFEFYPKFDSESGIFQCVQYIDVRIALLHDEKLLQPTQFVRILSIVSRLRMILISKIYRNDDVAIEIEISKIFEGILDRS